jgi:hypothetical protein
VSEVLDGHELDVGVAEGGVVAQALADLVLVVPLLVQEVLRMATTWVSAPLWSYDT